MSYRRDRAQQRHRGGGVCTAARSAVEKGFGAEFTALSSVSRRRWRPHGVARELCRDSDAHGNHAVPHDRQEVRRGVTRSPRSHSSSVGPGVGRVFAAPGLLFPVAQYPLHAGATCRPACAVCAPVVAHALQVAVPAKHRSSAGQKCSLRPCRHLSAPWAPRKRQGRPEANQLEARSSGDKDRGSRATRRTSQLLSLHVFSKPRRSIARGRSSGRRTTLETARRMLRLQASPRNSQEPLAEPSRDWA